jgi:hypothetical protein
MRRSEGFLKLALLQQKHRRLWDLVQDETDDAYFGPYKTELEVVTSELRESRREVTEHLLRRSLLDLGTATIS